MVEYIYEYIGYRLQTIIVAIILVDVDIPYNNGYGPTMVQS